MTTEKIVHTHRRWWSSESKNKTKHLTRFSPLLLLCRRPTKTCSTSLSSRFQQRAKEAATRSPSLNRAAGGSSGPLSLSLGRTDGLRLFTAGSSRHNSTRPSTAAGHQHQRLCAVSSAASLLLYNLHTHRLGKTSRSDDYNFCSIFYAAFPFFNHALGICIHFEFQEVPKST